MFSHKNVGCMCLYAILLLQTGKVVILANIFSHPFECYIHLVELFPYSLHTNAIHFHLTQNMFDCNTPCKIKFSPEGAFGRPLPYMIIGQLKFHETTMSLNERTIFNSRLDYRRRRVYFSVHRFTDFVLPILMFVFVIKQNKFLLKETFHVNAKASDSQLKIGVTS